MSISDGLVFKQVTFKNFMSYGKKTSTVNLNISKSTLILGADLDDTTQGTGSNGVGKSAILNAVTYAIYDKPIINTNKDGLINNINKRDMVVTINFTKNGKHYEILRSRKSKTSPSVSVHEDNSDITPDSIANSNLLIETIIGMPYEVFVRIVVFSAENTSFFNLPATSTTTMSQSNIIEHLVRLSILSEKSSTLKDVIKETEHDLILKKQHQQQLTKEHERYNAQLKRVEDSIATWDLDIINKRHICDDNIGRLTALIDCDVDIQEQQNLIEQKSILHISKNDIQLTIREVDAALTSITKQNDINITEVATLETNKCPRCEQTYENAGEDKAKLITTIEELAATQSELEDEQKRTHAHLIQLQEDIKQVESRIIVNNIKDHVEASVSLKVQQTTLHEYNIATNPHNEPLEDLKNMDLEAIDYSSINDLTSLIDHQKLLLKLLSKKDSFIRQALIDKSLPFLNERLREYLVALGLKHKVSFTSQLTTKISVFGRSLEYGNLSTGQKARINLALSFAFRDISQMVYCPINLCILDETLDYGLNAIGVKAALSFLKNKARSEKLSLFVITHRDEVDRSAFDNVLTVEMQAGFSNISQPGF